MWSAKHSASFVIVHLSQPLLSVWMLCQSSCCSMRPLPLRLVLAQRPVTRATPSPRVATTRTLPVQLILKIFLRCVHTAASSYWLPGTVHADYECAIEARISFVSKLIVQLTCTLWLMWNGNMIDTNITLWKFSALPTRHNVKSALDGIRS